jgi:uroporphyrinogen-III synthase
VVRVVSYRTVAAQMLSPEAMEALRRKEAGVLFYSARTVAHFAELLQHHGLQDVRTQVQAFCLSETVAKAARAQGFLKVLAAPTPSQTALLQLLQTHYPDNVTGNLS